MNFEAYLHYQEKHRLFLEEEERILAEKAKRSSHRLNPHHNPLPVNPEPTEQTGTPLPADKRNRA